MVDPVPVPLRQKVAVPVPVPAHKLNMREIKKGVTPHHKAPLITGVSRTNIHRRPQGL